MVNDRSEIESEIVNNTPSSFESVAKEGPVTQQALAIRVETSRINFITGT
jgi:hypothetical protein